MGALGVAGLVQDVRGFLAGLRRDLPEIFSGRGPAVLEGLPFSSPARDPGATGSDSVRDLFADRVRHWSGVMEVSPGRIFMKNQRTLWGSCSARGNLNFNRALASAPPEVLDYVVIHELAHLREMNHSPRFWAIVSRWSPEQKRHRRWLRQNRQLLARTR